MMGNQRELEIHPECEEELQFDTEIAEIAEIELGAPAVGIDTALAPPAELDSILV